MTGTAYLLNTPTDRSGVIVVVAGVGVCWSLTVLVTRLTGRLSRRHGLGWEDWGIVASTCLSISSSIAIFAAVKNGFGQSQSLQHVSIELAVSKALYAADILYILALALSKFATLQLILALSPARQHKMTCYAVSGLTALWGGTGVFVVAIRCDVASPWMDLTATQCDSLVRWPRPFVAADNVKEIVLTTCQFSRWCAIESISLLIEVLIWAIAAAMVVLLQMPRRSKLNAMTAFSVRLPVIIPTVLRLYYLHTAFHSTDYNLDATKAIIATQCVAHYATMSASFSYLKPFLAAFDSNLGASNRLDTVVATRSSERRKNTAGYSGDSPLASGHTTSQVQREGNGTLDVKGTRNNSADSDAPIIVKTTSYRVEVDA